MTKVVIDTNVLVSSRLSADGNAAKIMDLIADGEIELYYSSKILDEYERVLAYEKFKFNIKKQKDTINQIKEIGILTTTNPSSTPFGKDESDRIFYDTAKQAKAILVTGNMKHYPSEPFIKSQADYLDEYRKTNIRITNGE